MSFKNLLVHLDDAPACAGRLAVAIELAQHFEAHLTGLYVAADVVLPGSTQGEIPLQLLATLEAQSKARTEDAAARFRKATTAGDVAGEIRTARSAANGVARTISLHARYADLVILGQPEAETATGPEGHIAESVILSAGRPGLVVPYIGAGKRPGKRVLVAWDGGREAARAVNDAMPFLKGADKVMVLVINPHKGGHGPEPGADISLHLARHGVRAEAQHIAAADLSTGNALMSRLADLDADLLVMGAYGHSRLREWILGGVTREVFQQMTVPVFMSH